MTWPDSSDYNQAIQNPKTCFKDSELKNGQVDRFNSHGIPWPISGNFADVYKMKNGSQRWAVRCFRRQDSDRQRRYSILSNHLQKIKLLCMVKFEYQPQGIRVRANWYPILKMEWVEGVTLNTFIETNLHNSTRLKNLADQWRNILKDLYAVHIAHGDLQHGNILVEQQGQLKLVDYDGMFIPTFQGENSPEIGHDNYQHPLRNTTHYGEWLDNFAALVIYLSLQALSEDPQLWNSHTGENLILSSKDFKEPTRSPVIKKLKQNSDSIVRCLTEKLELYCQGDIIAVPNLEKLCATISTSAIKKVLTPWWKSIKSTQPIKPASSSRTVTSTKLSSQQTQITPQIARSNTQSHQSAATKQRSTPTSKIRNTSKKSTTGRRGQTSTLLGTGTHQSTQPVPDIQSISGRRTYGRTPTRPHRQPRLMIRKIITIITVIFLTAGILSGGFYLGKKIVDNKPLPKQVHERINPKDGAVMVYIPAGEFIIGTSDYKDDEKPQRRVYLDDYWIYKYEVTVAQYRKFCNETGHQMPFMPPWGWRDDHPIVNVSYDDAVAYCKWAGVRLPTEAQWEKAARGADSRIYPWGNKTPGGYVANYNPGNYTEDGHLYTSPVGSYPSGASPYGLMDMAGNVWEWCADWYNENYYQNSPTRNPQGPSSGTLRVLRGGAWNRKAFFTRAAYRAAQKPHEYGDNNRGFRCSSSSVSQFPSTPKEKIGKRTGPTKYLHTLFSKWTKSNATTIETLVVALDGSGKYNTVQAAINAAPQGATVRVKAGTYKEAITLKNGVHIIGAGAKKTMLTYSGDTSAVVTAQNCSSGSLKGVKVTYLGKSGAASILLISSDVIIKDCIVTGGTFSGIEIRGTSKATITNNQIRSNACGVFVHGDAKPVVEKSIIEDNIHGIRLVGYPHMQINGIAVAGNAQPQIGENKIRNHYGNGILVYGNSRPVIENNIIEKNSRTMVWEKLRPKTAWNDSYSGIEVKDNAQPQIRGNKIRSNGGSGIFVRGDAKPVISNNAIEKNEYGIKIDKPADATLMYNEFRNNKKGNIYRP